MPLASLLLDFPVLSCLEADEMLHSSTMESSLSLILPFLTQAVAATVAVPQPIGPDPRQWQQTEDFPEGTGLTHDQASTLLSGKGFH